MAASDLPELPASLPELVKYISNHPEQPISELIEPYRHYEARLRTIFAQDPQNSVLDDPYVNALPIFTQDTHRITTRARTLSAESADEQAKYIMLLPEERRRPQGSPAVVPSLAEFQRNFSIFSESSISDMNWDNVVAAGSSVVNCLLPVPKAFNANKRTLREYYHEKFCPASDVDLFLYGLSPEEAVEKIKQIERAVKDALLHEVTVVRTKYAITLASQHPVRHVQIVLRVYKSISEMLAGFDVDASGGVYDGKQVYVSPRTLASFITQINHVDLTRRSPSYENRLSKYSHRNFEVYWSDLDRARIDPTVFERSFKRTLGLARLLVLERLPTTSARETYLNKRRQERGRPVVSRNQWRVSGNIKDDYEDEIADWLSDDEVSNYHTFSVPYGRRFNAKKIEKLCYSRDLLLNAEWNRADERKVRLHRHPAFFGRVKDVVKDCCGSCPKPVTEEEIEISEKESRHYISGEVSFLTDDPGRQAIGSFNPLTEQDWTEMAYVGNTTRLCQSIVDRDVDEVTDWLSQNGADVNKRDHTGRTPLQLAVISSTPEVVRCLVEHGARLISRLADGRTALHLAAARGNAEMITILMEKSNENEEAEAELQSHSKIKDALEMRDNGDDPKISELGENDSSGGDGDNPQCIGSDVDGELVEHGESDSDEHSLATGSFVKVKHGSQGLEEADLAESEDEPDIYDVNVLAWDVPCSPLHLAIASGHEDAVKILCDHGADYLLPVKFSSTEEHTKPAAILTLTLALGLPSKQATSMVKLLLSRGAVSSQAESDGTTAFHRVVECGGTHLMRALMELDSPGVRKSINHIVMASGYWRPAMIAPLHTAIDHNDPSLVSELVELGAEVNIRFETWLKSAKASPDMSSKLSTLKSNQSRYKEMSQPIHWAISSGCLKAATSLLDAGADPNTLTPESAKLLDEDHLRDLRDGQTLLDVVDFYIASIDQRIADCEKGRNVTLEEPRLPRGLNDVLKRLYKPGTYQHWVVSKDTKLVRLRFEDKMKDYEASLAKWNAQKNSAGASLRSLRSDYEAIKSALVSKGAKTFADLYHHMRGEQHHIHDDRNLRPVGPDLRDRCYRYRFEFEDDDSITEAKKKRYLELMESAWTGDIERLKVLTLPPELGGSSPAPLNMAISDGDGNNPFSLAFLRGHHEAANVILGIMMEQWSSVKQQRKRYRLRGDASSFDEDESDGSRYEPRSLDIVSENSDHRFTIDDVGEEPKEAISNIKPKSIIRRTVPTFIVNDGAVEDNRSMSLFEHCFIQNDATGMRFLIEVSQHYHAQRYDDDEDDSGSEESEGEEEISQHFFTFPSDAFEMGIQLERIELLGLVIKLTGAGLPLSRIVRRTGVKIEEKPSKFYQGLTVYGRKRKDWANAGRRRKDRYDEPWRSMPPLLHAAYDGAIQSVEFFLSDTPQTLYSKFGGSKQALANPLVKALSQEAGGFERVVSRWLREGEQSMIHEAVSARYTSKESKMKGLKYLIRTCPDAVDNVHRDLTPLLMACEDEYLDSFKILIESGADQSARTSKGENLVHLILKAKPREEAVLRQYLALVDSELRANMFLQRTALASGSLTPIHAWIWAVYARDDYERDLHYWHQYRKYRWYFKQEEKLTRILQVLLDFSGGKGLQTVNWAGDNCLHTAVSSRDIAITRSLINYCPSLLFRENAVGRTPVEIARDIVTAAQFEQPKAIGCKRPRRNSIRTIIGMIEDPRQGRNGETVVRVGTAPTPEPTLEEVGLSGEYNAEDIPDIIAAAGLSGTAEHSLLSQELTEQVILDLCDTAVRKHPYPRRLVSLNEANDVPRRLGEQHMASRYCPSRPRSEDGDDSVSGEGSEDESGDSRSGDDE